MSNIYNYIDANKRNTLIIMAFFIMVFALLGYVLGEIFDPGFGTMYVGLALIFSGISSLFSYYNSDKVVLAVSRARELKYEEGPQLHNLVENMCLASGLPKPKIFMIHDSAMNAFATGRDPQHSSLCFTSGIVERLDKRELEGVVAHELSHVQNYDIRLMSLVTVLVGSVTLLADWVTRGIFYGGGRRRGDSSAGGIFLLIGVIFLIISPLIATLIKLALSRQREYLADSSAAMMTRYPKGLADALRKLAADNEVLEAANAATAHLYITNPLKGASFSALFNSHPPVDERIARLEKM